MRKSSFSPAFIAALAVGLGSFCGQAFAQEPIKIGVVLTFVPPGDTQSNAILEGMKMALEEQGGAVSGRKVELVTEDDEGKPSAALNKIKKLILSDHVDVVAGALSSNIAIAVAPFAAEKKTPFVIANAGADVLTREKCSPWVVRTSFSNTQIVAPLAPWLVKNKSYKKVFIITPDYQGGRDVAAAFRKSFTQVGGEIIGEAYTPFGQTQDFAPYLVLAKAANPDAIYTFFSGSEAILFIKQYAQFGLKGKIPLLGPAWTVSPLVLDAQGDAAEGFLGTLNYTPTLDNPVNKKFAADYEARTKLRVNEFAEGGFVAVKQILTGLHNVSGQTSDKDALIKAIREAQFVAPRGPLKIDPKTNNVIQNVYITEVKNVGGRLDLVAIDTVPDVRDEPQGCNL
jgi:branched-chain amino acid transport system substrate-binding protein